MKKVFFLSSLVILAIGCSGSGGGSGGGAGGGGNAPQTKEEALQKLTEQHRANFENWKNMVTKSCSPAEAFGLQDNSKQETGIDAAVLLAKNNHSLVFSDSDNLAILTDYNSFAGVANAKVEENSSFNGQGYSISAETKRNGSNCELYLFGVKVHETYIAASFTIGAQVAAGAHAETTGSAPLVNIVGPSGAYEVSRSDIFNLLNETLRPNKLGPAMIAKKLGLNEKTATELFRFSGDAQGPSAVRIANDAGAIWTNVHDGTLVSRNSNIRNLFDGNPRSFTLELRLGTPSFSIGEAKNTGDDGTVSLLLPVSIKKNGTDLNYSVQGLQPQGLVVFSKTEAFECAKSRADAFRNASGLMGVRPSVDTTFNSCNVLFKDILAAAYDSGLMKELLPQVLAGVQPSQTQQYNGWAQVLSIVALELVKNNQDVAATLDPRGQAPLIGLASQLLQSMSAALLDTKSFANAKTTAYEMALQWSFQGQTVSENRIREIIQAIENTIEVFPVSSKRLMDDLGLRINDWNESLAFAKSINTEYKNEALLALSTAQGLNYKEFESEVFNSVIQDRTPVSTLRDWTQRLSAIRTEMDKYPQLNPVRGDLTSLSVKWLNSGTATTQDMASVYAALGNSVEPFAESTQTLIHDLGPSLTANKEALDFASNLTSQYKQTAIAIRDNARAAGYESWGKDFFSTILQKRPSLDQLNVWNQMWTAALAFIQREKARLATQFGSTDWALKSTIETAVKETWSNQEFTALETMAALAKLKSSCDHYPDASSQANCASRDLFSKGTKKFFDPAYANRYASLSTEFVGYVNSLSGFGKSMVQMNLLNTFFGSWEPIWSKCDQNTFNSKAATLRSAVTAYAQTSDPSQEWDLERKIRTALENCN